MEKEARLPRGTLVGAFAANTDTVLCCAHARASLSSARAPHVSGGTRGETRNSVHSEAFGREVCSACTLHPRCIIRTVRAPGAARRGRQEDWLARLPSSLFLWIDRSHRSPVAHVHLLQRYSAYALRAQHANYALTYAFAANAYKGEGVHVCLCTPPSSRRVYTRSHPIAKRVKLVTERM